MGHARACTLSRSIRVGVRAYSSCASTANAFFGATRRIGSREGQISRSPAWASGGALTPIDGLSLQINRAKPRASTRDLIGCRRPQTIVAIDSAEPCRRLEGPAALLQKAFDVGAINAEVLADVRHPRRVRLQTFLGHNAATEDAR